MRLDFVRTDHVEVDFVRIDLVGRTHSGSLVPTLRAPSGEKWAGE